MRILIADDNEMVRSGVAHLMSTEEKWQVCGQAKDGAEAIQKTLELLPDLILLDISMPGMSGLEAARILRDASPGIKILIMSQHDPVLLLPRAREAGADGCVDKSRLHIDLLPAIKNFERLGEAPAS